MDRESKTTQTDNTVSSPDSAAAHGGRLIIRRVSVLVLGIG